MHCGVSLSDSRCRNHSLSLAFDVLHSQSPAFANCPVVQTLQLRSNLLHTGQFVLWAVAANSSGFSLPRATPIAVRPRREFLDFRSVWRRSPQHDRRARGLGDRRRTMINFPQETSSRLSLSSCCPAPPAPPPPSPRLPRPRPSLASPPQFLTVFRRQPTIFALI